MKINVFLGNFKVKMYRILSLCLVITLIPSSLEFYLPGLVPVNYCEDPQNSEQVCKVCDLFMFAMVPVAVGYCLINKNIFSGIIGIITLPHTNSRICTYLSVNQ